jgi:hypothetical protein
MRHLERAEAFAAALMRDLDRCAALERETAAIIAELADLLQLAVGPSRLWSGLIIAIR